MSRIATHQPLIRGARRSARAAQLLVVLLLSSCAAPPRIVDQRHLYKKAPIVRVALLLNERQASLSIAGPFKVFSGAREVMSGDRLSPSLLQAAGSGIWLRDRCLPGRELRITTERDGAIAVNGTAFRGELLVRASSGLTVINRLDMERYLASVVGSEAIESWPDDALRAQAVAARTYALYKLKASSEREYDVRATTDDQVYLGMTRETPKLRRIVKDTEGVALLWNGKVFPAYFHSTCAGHTEEVSRALKYESIPPLRGVPCNYCVTSKYYNWWSMSISAESLAALLRRSGKNVGRIQDIQPMDIGPSSRALNVRILHDRGTTVMNAYEFRKIVGPGQLRNTNFQVRRYGDTFEFVGRGWGHGVGMCQFGAKGIAEKGYSYVAILKYYYPGATVARVY